MCLQESRVRLGRPCEKDDDYVDQGGLTVNGTVIEQNPEDTDIGTSEFLTMDPSPSPTISPTFGPTEPPNIPPDPTVAPTLAPSYEPTAKPTDTEKPSMEPTFGPTEPIGIIPDPTMQV